MNEIAKLYKKAGIEKKLGCKPSQCFQMGKFGRDKCAVKGCIVNEECYKNKKHTSAYKEYPSFTEKKQLELIKFILGKGVYYNVDKDTKEYWFHLTDDIENASYKAFDEAITEFINIIWKDLTKEEKQEIKEILK